MTENIKILIADDNKQFCENLKQFLESKENMIVVGIADNGVDALKMVEDEEPDILILDLILPRLDGLGVLNQLNGMNHRPKVIISTAMGQENMTQEAVRLGIDYFRAADLAASRQHRPTAGNVPTAESGCICKRSSDAETVF